MNRWTWHRTDTGEPVMPLRVEHHLTREDIAGLLCSSELETGKRVSQALLLHAVRSELRAAPVLEPVETWAFNLSAEETEKRLSWAEGEAQRFYERTSR